METSVIVGGDRYVPISQDLYGQLLASLERSRRARYLGMEDVRLWLKTNKGTENVEEGLQACTLEELRNLFYAHYGNWFSNNLVSMAYRRLVSRAACAKAEIAAVSVVPIEPGGGGADVADYD